MEAVQNCEKLAYEYGNQEIDEEHLLCQPADAGGQPDSKAADEDGDPGGILYEREVEAGAGEACQSVRRRPALYQQRFK